LIGLPAAAFFAISSSDSDATGPDIPASRLAWPARDCCTCCLAVGPRFERRDQQQSDRHKTGANHTMPPHQNSDPGNVPRSSSPECAGPFIVVGHLGGEKMSWNGRRIRSPG
jgi:hypothetical protein